MMNNKKIIVDPAEIAIQLKLYKKEEEPYIINRLSDVCLGKLVELIMRNKFGDPLNLLPFQRVILYMLWNKKFPMLIGSRGLSKSFLLAVYSLLKALIIPGSKIVIVSGGFRQAKLVMNYIDDILRMSPILQEAISKFHPGSEYGVKYAVDKAYLKVGPNTEIIALPLGDGCLAGDTMITTEHGFCNIEEICKDLFVEKQIGDHDLNIWGNNKFRKSDSKINNGIKPTLKIKTKCGYSIEGTSNHQIRLFDANKWCRFDNLKIGDKISIDVSKRWHNGKEVFSEEECKNLGKALHDERDGFFDQDYWLDFWNVSTEEKCLPNKILSASKENMATCLNEFIRLASSLKMRDNNDFYLVIKNKSNKLLKQIHYILLHYGIISILQENSLIIEEDFFETYIKNLKNFNIPCNNISVYHDEIISIEPGECNTYDIHIPDGNEYCANGFFSHNSRIRGFRACVEPDAIVETNKGLKRIKDIVENPEDILLKHDNNQWAIPTKFVKTIPIDAYKVKLHYGYEIICSDIHRLWTKNGWKDVIALNKDDEIKIYPGADFATESKVGKDLAWLLGIMISEGACKSKYRIAIRNTDPILVKEIERVAKNIFGKYSIYYYSAQKDKRGWNCKECWEVQFANLEQRTELYTKYGLDYGKARNKRIPRSIIEGTKEEIIAFLNGLYDGDGTAVVYKNKKRPNSQKQLIITYYSGSYNLIKDLQIILLKLGIFSYRTSRPSKLSTLPQYNLRISAKSIRDFADIIQPPRFVKKYEQVNFSEYKQKKPEYFKVESVKKLDGKHILYDFEIPESKSFLANGTLNHNTTLILDETASVNEKVFDTAVAPFLSVNANPAENVMLNSFVEKLRKMNAKDSIIRLIERQISYNGNQLILAGTASFEFNHFFKRYQSYRLIATSNGNKQYIKDGLQQMAIPNLNPTDEMIETWANLYKEYAIFQLPYYAVPKGFLDAAIISSHRLTMDPATFEREYHAKFTRDTNGFFPRSILDDASLDNVNYELYGDPRFQYVMGLDPARHNDNFGLVVLKLTNNSAECVYVESWNKAKFHESVVRIRSVLKRFPNIIKIAMDRGGGGDTIQELLANPKLVPEGQRPIIETEPSEEFKGIKDAQRILEMVNFHTWAITANHALKSDIILKNITFPSKLDDDYIMEQSAILINKDGKPFDEDSKEDLTKMAHISDLLYGTEDSKGHPITLGVYKELQEMLNEICAIVQSVTEKGNETFGLSKISEQSEGLDIRRRDRYSALLLAAYAARVIKSQSFKSGYNTPGGTPSQILSEINNNFIPMRRRGGVVF